MVFTTLLYTRLHPKNNATTGMVVEAVEATVVVEVVEVGVMKWIILQIPTTLKDRHPSLNTLRIGGCLSRTIAPLL